jgi:hypothetical protein
LVVTSSPIAAGSGAGVRGTYYDNPDFTALRRARVDAAINFQWGAGSPSSTMQADTFSARWTGQLQPRLTQSYRFHTRTDDGVRLWINGALVIDKWIDQGAVEWSSAPIPLTAGQKYDFVMEYYENAGDALAELRWSAPSLLKEIIPTTQLYRPPAVLATIPATQVLQGNQLAVTVLPSSFDPLLSSQPWADFEAEIDGTTDLVLFRKPQFSGSTSAFTDAAKTRETTVVATFPAGNSSTRALHVKWSWAPGAVNPWLRLTTAGASTLPNPVIDFRRSLRFDVWSEHTLKFALGLRETNPAGAIGSDGGTAGPIEFVGVSALSGTQPVPTRTLTPDAWHTLDFSIPDEPVKNFVGNGVLESTTGLGVLEHLAIVPGSASVDHDVYLDNFVVVENNYLTYALTNGPAGATIDPLTGVIAWTPTAAQAGASYTFFVTVTDAATPPTTASTSFTVAAAPFPELLATTRTGGNFTFSWKAAPGAKYDVESAPAVTGPWGFVTEVTAAGASAAHSVPIGGGQQYYRARLK